MSTVPDTHRRGQKPQVASKSDLFCACVRAFENSGESHFESAHDEANDAFELAVTQLQALDHHGADRLQKRGTSLLQPARRRDAMNSVDGAYLIDGEQLGEAVA